MNKYETSLLSFLNEISEDDDFQYNYTTESLRELLYIAPQILDKKICVNMSLEKARKMFKIIIKLPQSYSEKYSHGSQQQLHYIKELLYKHYEEERPMNYKEDLPEMCFNLKTMDFEPVLGPLITTFEESGTHHAKNMNSDNFMYVWGFLTGIRSVLTDNWVFLESLPIKYKKPNWKTIYKMCKERFSKPFDALISIPFQFGHIIKLPFDICLRDYEYLNRGRRKKLSVINCIFTTAVLNNWDTTWIPCKLNDYDRRKYLRNLKEFYHSAPMICPDNPGIPIPNPPLPPVTVPPTSAALNPIRANPPGATSM